MLIFLHKIAVKSAIKNLPIKKLKKIKKSVDKDKWVVYNKIRSDKEQKKVH